MASEGVFQHHGIPCAFLGRHPRRHAEGFGRSSVPANTKQNQDVDIRTKTKSGFGPPLDSRVFEGEAKAYTRRADDTTSGGDASLPRTKAKHPGIKEEVSHDNEIQELLDGFSEIQDDYKRRGFKTDE